MKAVPRLTTMPKTRAIRATLEIGSRVTGLSARPSVTSEDSMVKEELPA